MFGVTRERVRQLRDHGQLDRKRVCRTFSYCTALMRAKDDAVLLAAVVAALAVIRVSRRADDKRRHG